MNKYGLKMRSKVNPHYPWEPGYLIWETFNKMLNDLPTWNAPMKRDILLQMRIFEIICAFKFIDCIVFVNWEPVSPGELQQLFLKGYLVTPVLYPHEPGITYWIIKHPFMISKEHFDYQTARHPYR
jgi:hypothetical protein